VHGAPSSSCPVIFFYQNKNISISLKILKFSKKYLCSCFGKKKLQDRMMKELHAQGKTIEDIVEVLNRTPIHPRIVPAIKAAHVFYMITSLMFKYLLTKNLFACFCFCLRWVTSFPFPFPYVIFGSYILKFLKIIYNIKIIIWRGARVQLN
jgi:hypothetical protein